MNNHQKNHSAITAIVLVVLGALLAIGIVVFMLIDGHQTSSNSDNSSKIIFLPVWLAILLPIIVARKKQKPISEDQKRAFIVLASIILGLTLLTIYLAQKQLT